MSRIYEQGIGYPWVSLAKKYINICKKTYGCVIPDYMIELFPANEQVAMT